MKTVVTLGATLCLSASFFLTAFAGQWIQDPEVETIWQYQRDDGTYAEDCWETIDGKSYHFDVFGWLDTNTITSDGYTVDENGAWIESVPQKTQEEMKQDTIAELIFWYGRGMFESQEHFEQMANIYLSSYCDSAEIQSIINDIRSNHTFISEADWNSENLW